MMALLPNTKVSSLADSRALRRSPHDLNVDHMEALNQPAANDDFESRRCQYPGCLGTRVFKQKSAFKYVEYPP